MLLPGCKYIEDQLNEGPRPLIKSKTDENETKNKTNVTPEKDNKTSARRIQGHATCGVSNLAREPPSLVLSVTFGHTTACRSPTLVFSAAIHFAMKPSAPCSAPCAIPPHLGLQSPTCRRRYRKLCGRPGNIISTLSPGLPRSPRPPPVFLTSRTLVISYPPGAPNTLRTRSASCV